MTDPNAPLEGSLSPTTSRIWEVVTAQTDARNAIWEKVDAFKQQYPEVLIGEDTQEGWLDEYEKHQLWLEYAARMWPDAPSPDLLSEPERAVLAQMRQDSPSEADRLL